MIQDQQVQDAVCHLAVIKKAVSEVNKTAGAAKATSETAKRAMGLLSERDENFSGILTGYLTTQKIIADMETERQYWGKKLASFMRRASLTFPVSVVEEIEERAERLLSVKGLV